MSTDELIQWAYIGIRSEKAAAWNDYLAARRVGNTKLQERMRAVFDRLNEAEMMLAEMEAQNDG
jgi:uncharacterized coiled-coil protein SlyX